MKIFCNIFLFVLFLGVVFFSCKKDKVIVPSTDFGYNYFPNDVGHYVIYQVDSIGRDDLSNHHDSTRYLLKELIAATFLDNANRPTLRIERYYQFYHFSTHTWDTAWSVPKVWTANRTQTTLEKKEENITYLKLVFPVKQDKQWNGNTYNALGDKEYQITSVDQHETINALSFDSVATVTQFQKKDIIDTIDEAEKYARNIGLIYKKRDSLYFSYSSITQNYSDAVGYRFTQKIISYGK